MKKATVSLCLLSLGFLATGCDTADNPERVIKDTIKLTNKVGSLTGTIKDEDTATAASSKLDPLLQEMQQLVQRAKTMGPLDKEKYKKLVKSYRVEMKVAQRKAFTLPRVSRAALDSDNAYLNQLRQLKTQIEEVWEGFRPEG